MHARGALFYSWCFPTCSLLASSGQTKNCRPSLSFSIAHCPAPHPHMGAHTGCWLSPQSSNLRLLPASAGCCCSPASCMQQRTACQASRNISCLAWAGIMQCMRSTHSMWLVSHTGHICSVLTDTECICNCNHTEMELIIIYSYIWASVGVQVCCYRYCLQHEQAFAHPLHIVYPLLQLQTPYGMLQTPCCSCRPLMAYGAPLLAYCVPLIAAAYPLRHTALPLVAGCIPVMAYCRPLVQIYTLEGKATGEFKTCVCCACTHLETAHTLPVPHTHLHLQTSTYLIR